jgi:hypothetical protein
MSTAKVCELCTEESDDIQECDSCGQLACSDCMVETDDGETLCIDCETDEETIRELDK